MIRSTVEVSLCLCAHKAIILLNNGPKAQELWCWQFSHVKRKGGYSAIRYFEREGDRTCIIFITMYRYNYSILLLVSFYFLIVPHLSQFCVSREKI